MEEEGKMITDWLDKHGDPKIEKLVENQLMDKETLEEAAERHYVNCIPSDRHSFITGAKWQAERMYSRQDLVDFVYFLNDRMYSEEEVLNFTQIILSQYIVGNTNIAQLDLLKETLHIFKKD
jgi:hypothetical protein